MTDDQRMKLALMMIIVVRARCQSDPDAIRPEYSLVWMAVYNADMDNMLVSTKHAKIRHTSNIITEIVGFVNRCGTKNMHWLVFGWYKNTLNTDIPKGSIQ